jgi:hypothetical protein
VRSAHKKSPIGEITVKKTTLIIALAIVFNIGVLADGDQGSGTKKNCVPTPTQPCTNFAQPEEPPVYVKILEFLKTIF